MWNTVQTSCEATFYSDADWVRLRHGIVVRRPGHGQRPAVREAWAVIQHGLNELLLSPAIKRRAGIELRPPAVDADAEAAVSMIGRYRQSLKPV